MDVCTWLINIVFVLIEDYFVWDQQTKIRMEVDEKLTARPRKEDNVLLDF